MLINFILLFLFAGVPYYIYFEKTKKLKREQIFFLSTFLLLFGIILDSIFPQEISMPFVIVAFMSSLFTLYQANKTTNLYKLAYYVLFFNAPILIMFKPEQSVLYALSLLLTLFGLYLIAKYYERSYGSANYQSVSGITLMTPYAGLFLTTYLTALALYPPFPNSILFLHGILATDMNAILYFIIVVIFFGNFLIAARVMAKTVFGKPNDNIHYIDLTSKEKRLHLALVIVLLMLSIVGLKEVLA
ncbi:MAG: hypothetical protein L3J43_04125 [Sulfurovum sp.]|nr:hypothetical protein [Sulfurovum sp.]